MAHNVARTAAFKSAILAAALLLTGHQEGHAFVEISRGELTLDLDGRIIYDSNVGGNALAISDTLFSFRPTLNYRRDVGRSNIHAAFGMDFSRYQDFESFNFDDYNALLNVEVPVAQSSRYSGDFHLSRRQDSGSDQSLLRRVQQVTTTLRFDSVYRVGAKTGLRLGLGYDKREPKDFSSSTNNDVRFGVQYQLRTVNALFLDYRYRTEKSNPVDVDELGVDNVSNAIFVGISRPLGGKVSGSISLGYEDTDARGAAIRNNSRWIMNANVNWTPRQATRFNLRISRDLLADTVNESVDTSRIQINMNQDLSQRFTLDLAAGNRWNDYQGDLGRDDRVLELTARLNYSFNSRLTAMFEYRYEKSSSNLALAEYTRNRVTLSVSYEF